MLAFIVIVMNLRVLFLVKGDDVPQNVVVITGRERTLDCARDHPYRWYIYRPENPGNAEIIFMGTEMAYDINQSHFQVYREPNSLPYNRLDLRIKDIKASDAGTYKCMQPQSSLCAELIVLESEPKCKRYSTQQYQGGEMVEVQCDVMVTQNGEPQMHCSHDNGNVSEATCSAGVNGIVKCISKVPAASQEGYCTIKIKSKPKRLLKYCKQATNDPEYHYTWEFDDNVQKQYALNQIHGHTGWDRDPLTMRELILLAILAASFLVNVVFVLRDTFLKCRKDGSTPKRLPETPPPEYASDNYFTTPAAPGHTSMPLSAPEYSTLLPSPVSTYVEIIDPYGAAEPAFIVSPYS